MSDTAAPGVKKAKKPAKPADHPPYAAMVADAIKGLGNKKGSSRQAILKYIVANNKVDAARAALLVRMTLARMVASKKVIAAAAAGKKGAGSFKLGAELKKPRVVKKAKAKKPAVKKPKKSKKPSAKKVAKKPAAKKVAKKPAAKKSSAKKPAVKKAVKPAAKKAAAKK
jgi:histone H1/5